MKLKLGSNINYIGRSKNQANKRLGGLEAKYWNSIGGSQQLAIEFIAHVITSIYSFKVNIFILPLLTKQNYKRWITESFKSS